MNFKQLVENLIDVFSDLNINRDIMPQIPKACIPDFLSYLDSKKIYMENLNVFASELKPSQTQIDTDKIEPEREQEKPLLISNDFYILDGHHGWASWIDKEVSCIKIDLPMEKLIPLTWEFIRDTQGDLEL